MDFINLLGSAWPEGNFWASLIKFFDVGSYAWTIIIFTIILKLVLSPLDFLQRFYTNKTTRAQAKLQPELEKLKKRYGQNQTLLYQKQNELYQKNNVSMKGSCIVMLLYMVVTLTVFLTFYSSLQEISGFKIKKQYEQLQSTYYTSYEKEYYQDYLMSDVEFEQFKSLQTQEEKNNYVKERETAKVALFVSNDGLTEDEAKVKLDNDKQLIIESSQIKVAEKYLDIKDDFLWIKNIWRSDKATVREIAPYDDFKALTGSTSVSKEEYNLVMNKLLNNYKNSNQVNGYYILSVIVVGISLLSQWLMKKASQPKAKNGEKIVTQQPGMGKILMFLMPIMMLFFTLNSSSIFALYIITNTAVSTALTPIITFIANKIEDKKEEKHKQAIKVDYRR